MTAGEPVAQLVEQLGDCQQAAENVDGSKPSRFTRCLPALGKIAVPRFLYERKMQCLAWWLATAAA